ncbi:hypothetical protein GQX73_g1923 [Xylaria multiplex]|uniref:Rhodopsin domain-containing protein n=1 Tax=Xylaria multiplex TaxID=323545 RepID=A0A7C8MYL1_9PEZI|nr:hypothetical protein GQX73_g1923 [Xylaria multiplex]
MDSSSPPQFPPGYLETNNGVNVIIANSIILVLATLLYMVRLIARSLAAAKRGWDDHLLIPAYLTFIGTVAVTYAEVTQAGVGRHAAALALEDPDKITKYLLLLYLLFWFYVPSSMFSRVSVVVLYLRIFTDKWARAACWVVIAFLVSICIGNIITAQVACKPLAYTWDKSIPGGTCINQLLWYQATNFFSLAADVFVLLLPIKTIWSLQTSFSQKIGIALVCLTGSIYSFSGLIASSVRVSVFFVQADLLMNDPTFADQAFSWTTVECGFYFSAACLIGSRPIITRFPQAIKDLFRPSSKAVERGSTKEVDETSLNRYYQNRYVNIEADEASQIPLEPMVTIGHHSPESLGGRSDMNAIRVETDIEIWREYAKPNPGNDWK